MNRLISIIIPVYKVEKYIEKCMQSLLDQTYENFEALVIDDGSPDNSITLAKKLIGNDSRFIFLKKENGGQGTARNLGLDHAIGDYIVFLDSDDSYTSNMLHVIAKEFAQETDVDILNFGINFINEDLSLIRKSTVKSSYICTDNDPLLLYGTSTKYVCDKAFKKHAVSSFRFSDSIKTYEDTDLVYRTLYKSNIKNISYCLYNYTQRTGSTVYSLPPSLIQDRHNIVNNAKEFLKAHGIYSEYSVYFSNYYLIEMYYKPLIKIVLYSENYNSDLKKLLDTADLSYLSIKNLNQLRRNGFEKEFLALSLFKTNKKLFHLITKIYSTFKAVN